MQHGVDVGCLVDAGDEPREERLLREDETDAKCLTVECGSRET